MEVMLKPYYDHGGITIYHGDCREILPVLDVCSPLILTDPPYLTGDAKVPIIGLGVTRRSVETRSVGMPWGYTLGWIEDCARLAPTHWVVFAHFKMLGGLCSRLDPSAVFVWRKSNAPRMARPVPRLDCEFIVWSRSENSSCERMGEFKSLVLDIPALAAGCMAKERFLEDGSGKAFHPCQKPVSVMSPFIERLNPSVVIDPFAGTGTTLYAAKQLGAKAIGIEIEEKYCEIAAKRMSQEVLFA